MGRVARLYQQLFPEPPPPIRAALVDFQYQAVRRQIPSLHLTALVNVAIVMAVLWHQGAAPAYYAWMPLLGLFNLQRMLMWRRRGGADATPPEAAAFLRNSAVAAMVSVTAISFYSAWSFWLGLFPHPVLIPVSVVFGSFSIAQCLASMRGPASASILLGVMPSAAVMVASGDFLSLCLGVSAASVGLLQLRFLAEHQRHILATLTLQQEVEQLASRDPLTGLLNRRALLAAAGSGASADAALLVLDIDHFKQINDRHGHEAGDRVLFQFGALIAAAARPGDLVGRFGGEEFVMRVARSDALDFAEQLCRQVAAHDFRSPGCAVEHVTVSIGVQPMVAGMEFEAAFAAADKALYAAKAAGRNRACRLPARSRSAG